MVLQTLTFATPGSNGLLPAEYSLCEDGKPGDCVTGTASGANVVFDLSAFGGASSNVISNYRTYVITPTMALSTDIASLTLLEDGVTYDVDGVTGATGLTTIIPSGLNFGTLRNN